VRAIAEGLADNASVEQVRRRLAAIHGATSSDVDRMATLYTRVRDLDREGRDGIWPYILHNLARPLMLSAEAQRADIVIGNPPWVAYRHLSSEMKSRLKDASTARNLWVGGKLATQQDLCAHFFAYAAERYLRAPANGKPDSGGTIAFVLPYAALNRPAFAGLRAGDYGAASVAFLEAWSLDDTVQPLFPVPACVLIARRGPTAPLPATVRRATGKLNRRDATEAEADKALKWSVEPWPPIPTLSAASPYRARFKQGATIVPRRFFVVDRVRVGRLGNNPAAPVLIGRVGGQDKKPWNTIEPPRGPVEAQFVKPLLLGESLAPFRLLSPPASVIPVDGKTVLDAAAATSLGFRSLAAWLRDCEAKWNANASKGAGGAARMTLKERLDHQRTLSGQFPLAPLRVAYAKAGTLLCAAKISDPEFVVDHMAYWAPARSDVEARYLCTILNSETVRIRIEPMQAKGQGGARHFDNLVWELPIPEYNPKDPLHRDLAAVAAKAERLAASVPLTEGAYFTTQRTAIRRALAESGLAARMDALVAQLLDP
jgi:hypothetical protein